jgi:ABC-2 type transport system ATP-binding protein
VLELVGLAEHAHRPLSGFSKGMLQRIGLAQALLNEPELVFLDEPTSALDPFGRLLVRGIIRDLKARGTTVFLNSHLLGEVEATCDRVSFIKEGSVLRTLALRDLEAGRLRVELRVDAVTPALLAALDDLVIERHFPGGEPDGARPAPVGPADHGAATAVANTTTTVLELVLADEELLPVVAERTLASGARLYALTPRRASLEQIFLEIVGMEDSGQ